MGAGIYDEGRHAFLESVAGKSQGELLDETARYMRAMLCHLDGGAALGALDIAEACDEAAGFLAGEVVEFDEDEHIRREDIDDIAQAAVCLLDDPDDRSALVGRLREHAEDSTVLCELIVPLIQSALSEGLDLDEARALLCKPPIRRRWHVVESACGLILEPSDQDVDRTDLEELADWLNTISQEEA